MLRRLFCAGATILLITGTAGAQSNSETQSPLSMPFKPKEPPPTQEQIERQKAADKAYEAVARQEVVRRSMGRRSSRQEQAIAAPRGSTPGERRSCRKWHQADVFAAGSARSDALTKMKGAPGAVND
jgi:hypothetical protein